VLLGLSRLLCPLLVPDTYARLRKEQKGSLQPSYWDGSTVAVVNALVNVSLAFYAIWHEPALLSNEDPSLRTAETCRMISVFIAWVIYETACEVVNWGSWPEGTAMLVHHVSAIIAFSIYLVSGVGHGLTLYAILCELTNPFMNMRYFLSASGRKSSTAYLVNGLLFVVSWLLIRNLFGPIGGTRLLWRQRHAISGLPPLQIGTMLLSFGTGCALNCYWGYKLFLGAYKAFVAKEHPKEE